MSDCVNAALQNIVSDCTKNIKGGNETKGWLIPRADISSYTQDATNPSLISAIALETGKKAYTIETNRRGMDSGHDFLRGSDGYQDGYTHAFTVKIFGKTVEEREAIDALDDVVIIVESRDKDIAGNGTFSVFGLENGLWKSSDSKRANSDRGARLLELGALEEEVETYSAYSFWDTDYATSKAALVALETEAA